MSSSKEMLVQYRSYAQANAVRNIIEMGNLLKELADWEKIEARRGEKQAGQATPTAPAKLAQKPQPVQPVAQAPVSPQPQAEPEVEPMGGPNAKITDLADGEFTQRPDELTMLRKNAGLNI
jgi:hypothetical protein